MKNIQGEPAYVTSIDTDLQVMRALNDLLFEQQAVAWFRGVAPALVQELKRQGVKFPKSTKARKTMKGE